MWRIVLAKLIKKSCYRKIQELKILIQSHIIFEDLLEHFQKWIGEDPYPTAFISCGDFVTNFKEGAECLSSVGVYFLSKRVLYICFYGLVAFLSFEISIKDNLIDVYHH